MCPSHTIYYIILACIYQKIYRIVTTLSVIIREVHVCTYQRMWCTRIWRSSHLIGRPRRGSKIRSIWSVGLMHAHLNRSCKIFITECHAANWLSTSANISHMRTCIFQDWCCNIMSIQWHIMQVIMFEESYILAILVAHYYMLFCIIQVTLQSVYMDTSHHSVFLTAQTTPGNLVHASQIKLWANY